MALLVRAKVLLHAWSYDTYDTTLSTDSNDVFPVERIESGAV